MAEGEPSGWVGSVGYVRVAVFPGVDEEAVETAKSCEEKCGGKERKAEVGAASDCGDERGSAEEKADGDLFGQTMRTVCGVNEDEVTEDQGCEDEI